MIYLNRTTGEYPRFVGDVELDPEADWAEVKETSHQDDTETEVWVETQPTLVDGTYHQNWVKVPRPPLPTWTPYDER